MCGHELLKGFIVVRVHVASNGLDAAHPFHANMVYEVMYSLFAFSVGKPQGVAGFQIDYGRRANMPLVEAKFIYGKEFGWSFRLYETLAVCRVLCLEALHVNVFDLNFCLALSNSPPPYLSGRRQEAKARALMELLCNVVSLRLKGDFFHHRVPAIGATIP